MRFIITLAALCSMPAFASCPNLAGDYVCTQASGEAEPHTITQTIVGNTVVYNLDKEWTIPADGQSYPMPGESLTNGKFFGVCTSTGSLHVEVSGQVYWGKEYEGDLTELVDFTVSGSNIKLKTNATLKPPQGANKIQAEDYLCTPR